MGEGAFIALLINDSVDPYDRYEHTGEGVFIAPLINTLTEKLSESCYSRDTPGRSTRGP